MFDTSYFRVNLVLRVVDSRDVGLNAVHTIVSEDYGNHWSER